jgi:oxygen-independent coproporphyrinogen-3 oxidase
LDLYPFPADEEVVKMLDMAGNTVSAIGMKPYYLYRQRFIAADMENVGYSDPGLESVYNIQMMEERQTILGMGGGGVTKMVNPATWEIERHFNPKCPATFANKYDELVRPKMALLNKFFRQLSDG